MNTASLARDLAAIVGTDGVLTDPVALATYDCDAYTRGGHGAIGRRAGG